MIRSDLSAQYRRRWQLSLRRHGVVQHHPHTARVDLIDNLLPKLDGAEMLVEKRKVDRLLLSASTRVAASGHEGVVPYRIGVGAPRQVNERRSSNVDALRELVRMQNKQSLLRGWVPVRTLIPIPAM